MKLCVSEETRIRVRKAHIADVQLVIISQLCMHHRGVNRLDRLAHFDIKGNHHD